MEVLVKIGIMDPLEESVWYPVGPENYQDLDSCAQISMFEAMMLPLHILDQIDKEEFNLIGFRNE